MRPIICLTPIKNEAWILESFLSCASLWADHIIVADQLSSDNSREIVRRFPKARLIENSNQEYSEITRQQILIREARKITDHGILFALDADEILGGNWETSPEWRTVKSARPGTAFLLPRYNLLPGAKRCWCPETLPFGFVDDGREHAGKWIHSNRVPFFDGTPSLVLKDFAVLHYQYIDWARMESKHRWYQCLEILRTPKRSALEIYRQYHHMDAIPHEQMHNVNDDWFSRYRSCGTPLPSPQPEPYYWWDVELLQMFAKYESRTFRRLAIWDTNYKSLQARIPDLNLARKHLKDPRNVFEKLVHLYLRQTQRARTKQNVKRIDAWLVKRGW